MAKKSKKKGKGGKTESTTAEVTPPPPSSTPPARAPITINDLPDELLDDIALFADQKTLPSLASVERRFYEPARRQTEWIARGLDALLGFADVLLVRDHLGLLVRYLTLEGRSKGHQLYQTDPIELVLSARVMIIILRECRNLLGLTAQALPMSLRWDVGETTTLLSQVAKAELLRELILPDYHDLIPSPVYGRLEPILPSLRKLHVFLRLDDHPLALPTCSPMELSLGLERVGDDGLKTLLSTYAARARVLELTFFDYRSPIHLRLTARGIASALAPFLPTLEYCHLQLMTRSDEGESLYLPTPPGVGWLRMQPSQTAVRWTSIWVGSVAECYYGFLHMVTGLVVRSLTTLQGKKGADWPAEEVGKLEQRVRKMGASIEWLK